MVTHFKFATGDKVKWLIAAKDQVYGFYTGIGRTVLKSSTSEDSYQAIWFSRVGVKEDPWISLKDHNAADEGMLYGGGNKNGHL